MMYQIQIKLGNDAMLTPLDISEALTDAQFTLKVDLRAVMLSDQTKILERMQEAGFNIVQCDKCESAILIDKQNNGSHGYCVVCEKVYDGDDLPDWFTYSLQDAELFYGIEGSDQS